MWKVHRPLEARTKINYIFIIAPYVVLVKLFRPIFGAVLHKVDIAYNYGKINNSELIASLLLPYAPSERSDLLEKLYRTVDRQKNRKNVGQG